jgi:hypothetical protein
MENPQNKLSAEQVAAIEKNAARETISKMHNEAQRLVDKALSNEGVSISEAKDFIKKIELRVDRVPQNMHGGLADALDYFIGNAAGNEKTRIARAIVKAAREAMFGTIAAPVVEEIPDKEEQLPVPPASKGQPVQFFDKDLLEKLKDVKTLEDVEKIQDELDQAK